MNREIPDSSVSDQVDGFAGDVVADIINQAQAAQEAQRQAALDAEYAKLRRWAYIQALWQAVWPILFFAGIVFFFKVL